MDATKGVVLWIGGGVGLLLVFAAYKGDSPLDVFKNGVTKHETASTSTTPTTSGGGGGGGTAKAELVAPSTSDFASPAGDNPYQDLTSIPTEYQDSPGTYIPSGVVGG